jgi:uncharacterized membrane protein
VAGPSRAIRPAWLAIGLAVAGVFALSPLIGWPAVTRVSIVLLAGAIAGSIAARPWRWDHSQFDALDAWTPSTRAVWTSAAVAGVVLFWFVLARFRSGAINAVDFTVYYDRPTFQTLAGRPFFIETANDLLRSQQSGFAMHAHWVMLPLAGLYAIHASPLWLLALSVVAVVAGAVNVLRIVERLGGGGLVAAASAIAFVLNDNTARTLNYGFHPEVLYAWLIPLLINLALAGRRAAFLIALVACVSIKEDAFMFLCAMSLALALVRFKSMTGINRALYFAVPPLAGFLNLGIYYGYVLPHLRTGGVPAYADYWQSYGATPGRALIGMLQSPWRVFTRALTSSFFTRVLVPHLFLPLAGWRWTLGIVPVVLLYGAADYDQLNQFAVYYAIAFVPFLVLGAAAGALVVTRRLFSDAARGRRVAAAAIILGSLVAGITDAGYSLRRWKPEVAAVPAAIAELAAEPVVLVQSGLYPHAGYDARVQLLTAEAVASPRNAGAAILLAPPVNAFPLSKEAVAALSQRPAIKELPGGLVAVRVTAKSRLLDLARVRRYLPVLSGGRAAHESLM